VIRPSNPPPSFVCRLHLQGNVHVSSKHSSLCVVDVDLVEETTTPTALTRRLHTWNVCGERLSVDEFRT
jgi:hypothetical protein